MLAGGVAALAAGAAFVLWMPSADDGFTSRGGPPSSPTVQVLVVSEGDAQPLGDALHRGQARLGEILDPDLLCGERRHVPEGTSGQAPGPWVVWSIVSPSTSSPRRLRAMGRFSPEELTEAWETYRRTRERIDAGELWWDALMLRKVAGYFRDKRLACARLRADCREGIGNVNYHQQYQSGN